MYDRIVFSRSSGSVPILWIISSWNIYDNLHSFSRTSIFLKLALVNFFEKNTLKSSRLFEKFKIISPSSLWFLPTFQVEPNHARPNRIHVIASRGFRCLFDLSTLPDANQSPAAPFKLSSILFERIQQIERRSNDFALSPDSVYVVFMATTCLLPYVHHPLMSYFTAISIVFQSISLRSSTIVSK